MLTYLPLLVPRDKWLIPQNNINVRDLVWIHETDAVKNQWCKAKVS